MNNLKLNVGDKIYCINSVSDYRDPYYINRDIRFFFMKGNYYTVDFIDYNYVGFKNSFWYVYFKYKGLGIFETFTPEHIAGKFEDYFITIPQLTKIQRKDKLNKLNDIIDKDNDITEKDI